MRNRLHVIAVISNPVRYRSRVRLMKEFIAEMESNPHVVLYIVEAAFGDRPHEVAEAGNPRHHQLKTTQEIWNKESLINIGMSRLPQEAQYVAWIDADIRFTRREWAHETMEALQHYEIVQPWSHAIDLGPNHELLGSAKSFCSYWAHGMQPGGDTSKYGYWHSGYAWAARRSALNQLGGPLCSGPLIDLAPLGSADFYMAWSLVGLLSGNLYNDVANADARRKGFTKPYVDALFQWQERAASLKGNIGYVKGTVEHFFHGRKKQRYYNTRENILIQNNFNPHVDLRRDINGLYQWVLNEPRQIKMRDEVRRYLRARNEDTIEID